MSAAPAAAAPLAERLARADGDGAWRDAARAALAGNRDELRERYARGEPVERLIDSRCAVADALVRSAWARLRRPAAPRSAATTVR